MIDSCPSRRAKWLAAFAASGRMLGVACGLRQTTRQHLCVDRMPPIAGLYRGPPRARLGPSAVLRALRELRRRCFDERHAVRFGQAEVPCDIAVIHREDLAHEERRAPGRRQFLEQEEQGGHDLIRGAVGWRLAGPITGHWSSRASAPSGDQERGADRRRDQHGATDVPREWRGEAPLLADRIHDLARRLLVAEDAQGQALQARSNRFEDLLSGTHAAKTFADAAL